ncbi:haloacid dehalogenase-like hydrolase [Dyella sp.]|uniref:haloacid dehalogenase-like hydrolase n=1 Tax=Dyella sp. TaxID=1869338 RepID=UPI002D79BAE7|nr:haloacid dehalogenase-like hydrolase [Dyella sp.]HET6431169.1 haloacid dehalogenase-like hydrolase [Dyella sp.]
MPRTVLFDLDGVITVGDSFAGFMRERYAGLGRKLLLLPALPWLALVRLFSWRLAVRTLVHVGLLGVSERRYGELAQDFASRLVRRPRQFQRDALLVLRRHQAQGDRVIVVTGSEHTLAQSLLSQLGLVGVELVASRLKPGALGMRLAHHNVGAGKVLALAAYGVSAWQRAYGDSLHDLQMLKAAAEPVLVNGTPKLCKRIEQALGRPVERVAWF